MTDTPSLVCTFEFTGPGPLMASIALTGETVSRLAPAAQFMWAFRYVGVSLFPWCDCKCAIGVGDEMAAIGSGTVVAKRRRASRVVRYVSHRAGTALESAKSY